MRTLILLAAALLGGCNAYTLVKNEPTTVGSAITVDPQREWSRITEGGVELWTVDGASLEAVQFFDGVEDGETLYTVHGEHQHPVFKANMTPTEVQELVRDTLRQIGAAAVETRSLRPFRIGGGDGFRFDAEFVNRDGLAVRAMLAGVLRDDRLYLIMYTGADTYYFDRYRDDVERLFGSMRLDAV